MMPQIDCLLWDFGDTLCDERFIWSSGPQWMQVYETFDDDGLGAQWCLGKIDTTAFSETLAKRKDLTPDAIVQHMTKRCQVIQFFEKTYEFFRSRQLPQAIVTVNPDIFSEVIVPVCDFQNDCDVIVTSWEEGTDNKRILNGLAIERMGITCDDQAALLLDNKQRNIEAWIGVGGSGYHYIDDDTFAADVRNGIDSLSAFY